MAKTPSKRDPQDLVSWHSPVGREGPDTPGPGWPRRGDVPAEKTASHSHHLMLHEAFRERRSANSLFQRSCQTCPWLHHGPGLLRSQAAAVLSFLHRNVYSHQHPPPLLTSKVFPYAASLSPRAHRLPSAQSKRSSESLPGCC